MPLAFPNVRPDLAACLLGLLGSFILDYVARQKLGGTNLTFFVLEQLPVCSPASLDERCPWSKQMTLAEWLCERVLELTYTAEDLTAWARDLGHAGPPFSWNSERRSTLRAELDAAFFHLYGLDSMDAQYVLDTFRIVKQREEAALGEYRTKRLILERFEALASAAERGFEYQSPLGARNGPSEETSSLTREGA